jgi:hypothetical protein
MGKNKNKDAVLIQTHAMKAIAETMVSISLIGIDSPFTRSICRNREDRNL